MKWITDKSIKNALSVKYSDEDDNNLEKKLKKELKNIDISYNYESIYKISV